MLNRVVRHATFVATACALVGASGCASLLRNTARTYDVTPLGLSVQDDAFRRALTAGSYAVALGYARSVKEGAPQDELLRALYRGTSAYYAGEYLVAANAFAEADRLAERRETRSVSRHAASLLTNDNALVYLPSRTERLFTRYYAMLSYLRADQLESARVEARRLGLALQVASDSIGDAEKPLHAVLRDAAGAVFEATGEYNDALVSYRNAAKLRGASAQEVDSIRLDMATGDSATVVVFVEAGFVAHRVEQELSFAVPVNTHEPRTNASTNASTDEIRNATLGGPSVDKSSTAMLFNEKPSRKPENRDRRTGRTVIPVVEPIRQDDEAGAATIASQIVTALTSSSQGVFADAETWRRTRRLGFGPGFDGDIAMRSIKLAWPALLRSDLPRGPLELVAQQVGAGEGLISRTQATIGRSSNVTDAVASDLQRALPRMFTRLLLRTTAKAAITEAVGDEYGWLAGAATGMVANALERADTRSWHLLPADVRVVRMRVPAGDISSVVQIGDMFEQLNVRLPAQRLHAGDVRVFDARFFRSQSSLFP